MSSYEHAINVNVSGTGKRPVVALWCMDCLWAHDLDQINAWDEMQRLVAEHCARPSKREALTRVTNPTTEDKR